MNLVVITTDELKKELIALADPDGVTYIQSVEDAKQYKDADAIIDLLFTKEMKGSKCWHRYFRRSSL